MLKKTLRKFAGAGRARRAALIFVPFALLAVLVFYVLYATQILSMQRVLAVGQKQLVEVGLSSLNNTFTAIQNDVQFVADEPVLHQWLQTGGPSDRLVVLAQFLSFTRHRALYDQVRFLGADGQEQVRVNWNSGRPGYVFDEQLQNKADRYYVRQTLALKPGQVFFSPFDLNVENGAIEQPIKPTIRVGVPVTDAQGRTQGLVVLNYLGQRIIDRVRGLDPTGAGEAWLIDADGNWLRGPDPRDEWGFMYPDRDATTFAEAHPEAWRNIEAGANQFPVDGNLFTIGAITLPQGVMTGTDTLVPASDRPSWYVVMRTPMATASQAGVRVRWEYAAALAAVLVLLGVIAGILAHHQARRDEAEREVIELNRRLARDNTTLEGLNRELESFSYSVSHDLRAPLRAIDGFSKALIEDYADALDEGGRDYLMRVRRAAQRMGHLIDDLLKLARVSRAEVSPDTVDLSLLARKITADLRQRDPQRAVDLVIAPEVEVRGDPRLLQIAMENLLENAWKFTSRREKATIEFGLTKKAGEPVYFIRDNGAGFDMAHAGKLFGAFQRLHAMTEFEGTGIGLATVQRIVYKHGGRVWGEAEKDRGATFFFTL